MPLPLGGVAWKGRTMKVSKEGPTVSAEGKKKRRLSATSRLIGCSHNRHENTRQKHVACWNSAYQQAKISARGRSVVDLEACNSMYNDLHEFRHLRAPPHGHPQRVLPAEHMYVRTDDMSSEAVRAHCTSGSHRRTCSGSNCGDLASLKHVDRFALETTKQPCVGGVQKQRRTCKYVVPLSGRGVPTYGEEDKRRQRRGERRRLA